METITLNGKQYQEVKQKTHIFAILDRSGSMSGLEASTIEGYNGFIHNLKNENAVVTTVLFDDQYEIIQKATPVSKVKKLDSETYFVRGGTALIDAVCRTMKAAVVPKTDKALVLIITDGHENSSREYDTKDFKSLVEKLEAKGNYTFTYLGANQDSWSVAKQWGFKAGNVANYAATRAGTAMAYDTMSVSSVGFTAQSARSTSDFFGKDTLKDAK